MTTQAVKIPLEESAEAERLEQEARRETIAELEQWIEEYEEGWLRA